MPEPRHSAVVRLALPVKAPSGLTLSYQTTNPATNALTGMPNTPATIAPGNGVQSFLVWFQGTTPFVAAALPLDFGCAGVAPAAIETGVDTLDLTLSATPVADIIALAATPSAKRHCRDPVRRCRRLRGRQQQRRCRLAHPRLGRYRQRHPARFRPRSASRTPVAGSVSPRQAYRCR
ncbi:MAG: hypothetical protein WDN69_14915 [Aliidongia sp.]